MFHVNDIQTHIYKLNFLNISNLLGPCWYYALACFVELQFAIAKLILSKSPLKSTLKTYFTHTFDLLFGHLVAFRRGHQANSPPASQSSMSPPLLFRSLSVCVCLVWLPFNAMLCLCMWRLCACVPLCLWPELHIVRWYWCCAGVVVMLVKCHS